MCYAISDVRDFANARQMAKDSGKSIIKLLQHFSVGQLYICFKNLANFIVIRLKFLSLAQSFQFVVLEPGEPLISCHTTDISFYKCLVYLVVLIQLN